MQTDIAPLVKLIGYIAIMAKVEAVEVMVAALRKAAVVQQRWGGSGGVPSNSDSDSSCGSVDEITASSAERLVTFLARR